MLYSADDAEHIGAFLSTVGAEHKPRLLGRGPAQANDEHVRFAPVQQRPGSELTLPPFTSPSLSRSQLLVRAQGNEALELTNVGRLPLAVNGVMKESCHAQPGDVIEIGTGLALLVVLRDRAFTAEPVTASHAFGEPDRHGYVGESPSAWQLRREIAFIGPRVGHVLVSGASGTGKELVAGALHALSTRPGELVARNAATFPETLLDAELFGNLRGYPNPGMPERKGLIGAADRGSLFLDEFGDLAPEAQARLLRVLDSGEYQRLGESASRRAEFRLIAATNRPDSALRSDLVARFDFRLRLPDLAERLEDLPLLVRSLLRTMTANEPELCRRVFEDRPWPKLSTAFVRGLVRHPYSLNVRELRALLWEAVSKGELTQWPRKSELPSRPAVEASGAPQSAAVPKSAEAAEIARVLDENNGSIEKAWRALGLTSRYALARLLRKHGIKVSRRINRR